MFSDNNGKELDRYTIIFGADPVDFEINVKGLRVTAEGLDTVSTVISPVLTK
ncbi:hypothetical protein [Exiguobacterium sp. s127]|uniref:hypothetical protein n=1 Tax=Exiguobacterium sp. s127 TaxID=2751210 RepID=UPI001BECF7D2|nr:hypothetical protein [Exiguobacterium sp. s127]